MLHTQRESVHVRRHRLDVHATERTHFARLAHAGSQVAGQEGGLPGFELDAIEVGSCRFERLEDEEACLRVIGGGRPHGSRKGPGGDDQVAALSQKGIDPFGEVSFVCPLHVGALNAVGRLGSLDRAPDWRVVRVDSARLGQKTDLGIRGRRGHNGAAGGCDGGAGGRASGGPDELVPADEDDRAEGQRRQPGGEPQLRFPGEADPLPLPFRACPAPGFNGLEKQACGVFVGLVASNDALEDGDRLSEVLAGKGGLRLGVGLGQRLLSL